MQEVNSSVLIDTFSTENEQVIDIYEQELVDTKTTVLNGLIAIIDKSNLPDELLNVGRIASELGVYDQWVYRKIKLLGIPSIIQDFMGVERAMYPSYTIKVLREVLEWERLYASLPNFLSLNQIAEQLGKSVGWTQKNLIHIQAQQKRGAQGVVYNKRYLQILRDTLLETPYDDGWYNLKQLVEHTGKSREWIQAQLSRNNIQSQARQSGLTGRVLPHYPPDTLQLLLEKLSVIKPGGDWVNANYIATETNKSINWVNNRLRLYRDLAEERFDDRGSVRLHYPPIVFDAIKQEAEESLVVPDKSDYVTLKVLMHATNHGSDKLVKILADLGIKPEKRKSKIGRIQDYYPPSAIDAVNEYDQRPNSNKTHEQEVLSAIFAIGSISATLRAKKAMIRTILSLDTTGNNEQLNGLVRDVEFLKRSLHRARNKLYRLQNNC
jgi:hypothetical protein